MRTSSDRMNLKDLEMLTPDRDVWPQIERVLERRQHGFRGWIVPAAAALLMISLGLIVALSQKVEQQDQELDQWVAYSQELEQRLNELDSMRTSYRGHEAIAVAELRDMVALVDSELARTSTQPVSLELWKRRAVILNDLYAVQAAAIDQNWRGRPRPVITTTTPNNLAAWQTVSAGANQN